MSKTGYGKQNPKPDPTSERQHESAAAPDIPLRKAGRNAEAKSVGSGNFPPVADSAEGFGGSKADLSAPSAFRAEEREGREEGTEKRESTGAPLVLLDLSYAELCEELKSWGLPAYRAQQIFQNLLRYRSFREMTDLPGSLRERLAERYCDLPATIVETQVSSDGTRKYLLELRDGELIECVWMHQEYGDTLCVSCQSGCRMGCRFCASGLNGLKRNLTAGEILAEVLCVNAERHSTMQSERCVTNIVMMGCGEPMDNYENTVRFLRLITAKEGWNVSARNISVSTCGLADRILRFSEEGLPVTLCFSMHSPFDERRASIMPIEKKFRIAEVLNAFEVYFRRTKRRFIIEYTVIAGFNDRDEDAEELKRLLRGRVCHVNLIPLNRVAESGLDGTRRDAENFLAKLQARRISATIRKSAGGDIDGACGQLRRRRMADRAEGVGRA